MGFFTRQEHLKFNGQKLNTMVLVNEFVDKNIDILYKNRDRAKNKFASSPSKLPISEIRKIEMIAEEELTER